MSKQKLKIYSALLIGALFCTSSKAQFANLLLESPLTLSATYTVYTEAASSKGTTQIVASAPKVVKLTQANIIADLQTSGVIPAGSLSEWSLVSVRSASARQSGIRGVFTIFAKNNVSGAKIKVPDSKFSLEVNDSFMAPRERVIVTEETDTVPSETYTVYEFNIEDFITVPRADQYIEVNQGNYVHSAKGISKTLIKFGYMPKVTVDGRLLTVKQIGGSGYMTTSFKANNAPVFYYGITAQTGSIVGAFSSTDNLDQAVTGEYSTIIKIGASKLVSANEYPDVLN